MDVDEELPGPSQEPICLTNETDEREISSPQTSSDEQPASGDASLGNENYDENHSERRAWTEDAWHTVLSRRQQKKQLKQKSDMEKTANANEKSKSDPLAEKEKSHAKQGLRRMKRRGPPPLPKEDIKIILRPHRGLLVKNILGLELSRAVIDACQQSFNGNDFLLRIHPGSNIVILSTPSEDVASRLREISQLNIRGTTHSFNAYVADPEGVLRGIVHGIPAGTSQAELMENLRVRTQGVKIERARMLGSSKTAIITFTGRVLPRSVYMMGAELICYPYKPTVQVCKICLLTGHRTDVCPTPNVNVCPKCGAREPTLGHHCTPKCAICDGEHPTGDSLCKKKLKSVAPPRKSRMEQPKKRGDQPEWTCDANSDSEFPQLELHKHRWFSSEREEQHQSRSRSQSPSSSRSISQSRNQWQINNGSTVSAHPGSSSLKKQNKSGGPQTKTGSLQAKESKDPQAAGRTNKNQVSWARVVSPSAPVTENPQYKKILEENKRLTQEVKQLRKQMAEERNDLHAAISSLERRLEAKLQPPPQFPKGTAGGCSESTSDTPSINRVNSMGTATSGEGGEGRMDENTTTTPNVILNNNDQLTQQIQAQLQENRQGIANVNKLLQDFMMEIKLFVGEELRTQRQYVNEAVGSLQRAINKRPRSASAGRSKQSKAERDDTEAPIHHGQK